MQKEHSQLSWESVFMWSWRRKELPVTVPPASEVKNRGVENVVTNTSYASDSLQQNKKRPFCGSFVELEGVEPSSKQLTDVLSTCLSGGWLSGWLRTSAPKATRSL